MKVVYTVVFFLGLLLGMPLSSFPQAGGLDSTFNGDGIGLYSPGAEHDNCYGMKVLADGKILTCGVTKMNGAGGPFSGMLMRVLGNGDPDLSWGSGGVVTWQWGLDTYAYNLIVQPDGKILVSGVVSITLTNHDIFVARFSADGTPDLTFNGTGKLILPYSTGDEDCKAMVLQPNGQIVLAGNSDTGSPVMLFTRVNANGTLDLSFGASGYRTIDASFSTQRIETLGILSNGTIVGMGFAEQAAPLYGIQAIMVKLTPGGNPMPGFGNGGALIPAILNDISTVNQITIVGDQIYATGYMYDSNNLHQLFLAKFDSAGVAVPSFGNGGIHFTQINAVNNGLDVKIFGDGKIYVSGTTGEGSFGNKHIFVLRYTANGLPDMLWNGLGYVVTPVRPDLDSGDAIDMQEDGKIVVAGNSIGISSGDNDVVIVRYLNDYVTLVANFTANDSTLCSSGTVWYTNLSTPGATSYLWTFQGGTPATSTAANPSVTYSTLGEFDVTLQVTKGMQTVTTIKDNYIKVYVIPGTPATPTGNTSLCQGENESYSVNPVTWATDYIWEVTPTAAGIFNGSGPTVVFTPSLTWSGNFSIQVKAWNFCGISSLSPPLACTLNPAPMLFSLNGNGSYCQGEPGAELTLSGSEPGVNYQLMIDGTPAGSVIPGTGSPLNFGFQTSPGNYTCQGISGPCSAYMSGSIQVQMLTIPGNATTPSGPNSPCNNTTGTYVTTSTQADTILWALVPGSAGTLSPTTTGTVEITWSSAFSGSVQLTAQGQNQCGTGSASPALNIFVNEAPDPQITGLSLVCTDEISAYYTANTPGNTYQWTVSGGVIASGAGTSQITVLWGLPGTGTVTLAETTSQNCVTLTVPFQVTIDACTGIRAPENTVLSLFPNPASDHFCLKGNDINLIRRVRLLTITGVCVKTVVFDHPITGPVSTVHLGGISPGAYLVKVLMNDGREQVFRLIRL